MSFAADIQRQLTRDQLIAGFQLAQGLVALVSFSVMASAETSHHTEYHYSFYPSLTFFVIVGVLSFLYSLFLVGSRQVIDTRGIQPYASGLLAWLTYTAAVAASATSTDLHSTFDQKYGSTCRTRHSTAMAMAGSYFCGRVVASVVFMYILCATHVASILATFPRGTFPLPSSSRYYFAGAGATYDEIDCADDVDDDHGQNAHSGGGHQQQHVPL